eukprot:361271-Chlamydomonas_euryale.AAC.6
MTLSRGAPTRRATTSPSGCRAGARVHGVRSRLPACPTALHACTSPSRSQAGESAHWGESRLPARPAHLRTFTTWHPAAQPPLKTSRGSKELFRMFREGRADKVCV